MAIAFDTPELFLRGDDAKSGPSANHGRTLPTLDVSRYSANGSVEILNGVSVRKYMESIDLPFLEIKALENLASRSARLGQAS